VFNGFIFLLAKITKTLIFGDVDKVYKDDVYNAILLNIKYYIYTNRCLKKKVSIHSLKACLINLYKTDKMIAVRNQRIAEFQLHWSTFEKLFEVEKMRLYFILAYICKKNYGLAWCKQSIGL
jgi:hypothetical protein